MRRTFMICIAVFALLSAIPASADVLTLTQTTPTSWTVSVTRPAPTVYIGGFDITVGFDDSVLFWSGTTFGNRLGDPDPLAFETIADAVSPPGPPFDSAIVSEVSFLDNSVLAGMQPLTFDLFTLDFVEVGAGAPNMHIVSADLSDGFGNPVIEAPIPEPGSWLLLLTMMGGTAAFMRRRIR